MAKYAPGEIANMHINVLDADNNIQHTLAKKTVISNNHQNLDQKSEMGGSSESCFGYSMDSEHISSHSKDIFDSDSYVSFSSSSKDILDSDIHGSLDSDINIITNSSDFEMNVHDSSISALDKGGPSESYLGYAMDSDHFSSHSQDFYDSDIHVSSDLVNHVMQNKSDCDPNVHDTFISAFDNTFHFQDKSVPELGDEQLVDASIMSLSNSNISSSNKPRAISHLKFNFIFK